MNSHPASSHFFILQVSSKVDPNHSAAAATPHQGYSHAGWGILAVRGLFALTLAAVGVAQAAPALPPLLLGEGALNPAWRFVGFPKKHADLPATRFEAGRVDGQAALKVVTASSYGTLVHDQKDVPPARLQWRWRLDQPLTGGKAPPDLLTKAGDDAALKVCVMFDHPLGRVPFVERTVLRIARSVSGEALPAATLCYVWDSGRPAPLQGANPYTRRVRFISLQGQGAPLGQWVNQSRDLAQDFSVLIGADSDNTASTSTGWVADLRWVDGRP